METCRVPKAPWFMGGVDCFVKQITIQLQILHVKESLHKLTHMEWETLISRISSILNERPLVVVSEPGGTICANNLLFGHNGNIPSHSGLQETSHTKRSKAIQENLLSYGGKSSMQTLKEMLPRSQSGKMQKKTYR